MIQLISSPYYLGHRNAGMGAGPPAFLDAGAPDRLTAAGHAVHVNVVEYDGSVNHEAGAAVAVNRALAAAVGPFAAGGDFPLVLGGNCNVCLGVIAGLSRDRLGIVWLDAHGDFHSTDTTVSGFFDGFPLSMAVGRSWKALSRTVPGFAPVPESNVLLAGHRDLDPGEDELVEHSDLLTFDLAAFKAHGIEGFRSALSSLAEHVDCLYLHVDLDVLDGDRFPVNPFAPGDGLMPNDLLDTIEAVGRVGRPVVAASLNCYDPDGDPDGAALAAGLDVINALAAARDASA